jgi:hypothetical protein
VSILVKGSPKVIELDPTNATAHYNPGLFSLAAGEKNRATQAYEVLKGLDIEMAKKLYESMQ